MSNRVTIRKGTEQERLGVVFSSGEPVFCTDSLQVYVGDGVTKGGRPIRGVDMPYHRAGYSYRFDEIVECHSVFEALDVIYQFMTNLFSHIYYGDVGVHVMPTTLQGINSFFAGLNLMQGGPTGPKDIPHTSNYTYRTIAYPKSFGQLASVQDPTLNYLDITNTYNPIPSVINYMGTDFYVYTTVEHYMNEEPKTVRYLIDYSNAGVVSGGPVVNVESNSSVVIHQVGHGFSVNQWIAREEGAYVLGTAASEFLCEVVGIVTRVVGPDDFVLTANGYLTGLTGLVDGYTYFLSDTIPGAMVTTPPETTGSINKPVFIADSSTSGFIVNYRGIVVQ